MLCGYNISQDIHSFHVRTILLGSNDLIEAQLQLLYSSKQDAHQIVMGLDFEAKSACQFRKGFAGHLPEITLSSTSILV